MGSGGDVLQECMRHGPIRPSYQTRDMNAVPVSPVRRKPRRRKSSRLVKS